MKHFNRHHKLNAITLTICGLFSLLAILQIANCLPGFAGPSKSTHYLNRHNAMANWIAVEKTGKVIKIDPNFRDVGTFENGLARFAKKVDGNWLYGYIDTTGKVVRSPQYLDASEFCERIALVGLPKKQVAIIDTKFNIRGKLQNNLHVGAKRYYPDHKLISSERICVYEDRIVKAKKTNLKLVNSANSKLNSRMEGIEKRLYGFIDTAGKIIVPPKYDGVDQYREDFAGIQVGTKWGFVDKSGREVIPPEYDNVGEFSEGLARVHKDKKAGFIDKKGELVIPVKFEVVNDFHEGLASFGENGKCGYLDKQGKVAIPAEFNDAGEFSEGLAAVKADDQWGYIDKSGKFVIVPKFYMAKKFSAGKAICAVNARAKENKIYYVSLWHDSTEPEYDKRINIDYYQPTEIEDYIKPVIKFGLIDRSGQFVLKPTYDAIWSTKNGTRRVYLDSLYGFIDQDGKELIPPKFSKVKDFSSGVAWVKKPTPYELTVQKRNRDPVTEPSTRGAVRFLLIEPDLLEESILRISEVIKNYPESANALHTRAIYYIALRKHAEAIEDLNAALNIDPQNPEILVSRANTFLLMKNWKRAEDDIRKSMEINKQQWKNNEWLAMPSSPYSDFVLEKALVKQKKYSQYKKLNNCGRGRSYIYKLHESDTFGFEAYEQLKDYESAERLIFTNGGMVLDGPYYIQYPKTESVLDTTYNTLLKELNTLQQNRDKTNSISMVKVQKDLVRVLDELIELKAQRYKTIEIESLLQKRIELIEKLSDYKMQFKHDRFWTCNYSYDSLRTAKLQMAKFYAEINDKRYKEIYSNIKFESNEGMHDDPIALEELAFYLSINNKLEKALSLYQKSPRCSFVNLRMAHLLKRMGRESEAEKIIEKETKKYQKELNKVHSKGIGKTDKDLYFFTPVPPMPTQKCTAEEYFTLAKRSNDFGMDNAALGYLKKASKSTEDRELLLAMEKYKKQNLTIRKFSPRINAKFCNYAYPYEKDSSDTFLPESLCLIGIYEQCIKEEPEFTKPYVAIMKLSNDIGDFDSAHNAFQRVMKINPDFLPAWVEAGRMYNLRGQNEKSKEAFAKVLELDSSNQLAQLMLKRL